jgi:hypothetical protein
MKKIFITILALIILIGAGYFGYKYFKPTSQPASPSPASEVLQTPEAKPTAASGTVSGRLCFPSDFLPPGEILAKDLGSGKTHTQEYPGSMSGGKLTYSFELPVGTYHLRYQAHGSTKKPEIFTSGYFDECAKTMATAECTPDSGHINIDITVKAGQETKNIDLCDFYYNPTQEQSLNQGF